MTPKPKDDNSNKITNGSTIKYGALIHAKNQEKVEPEDNPSSYPKALNVFSNFLFWGEKNHEKLESLFGNKWGQLLASISMFILGITARGEWVVFAVYFLKYIQSGGSENYVQESDELIQSFSDWVDVRFKGYFSILIPATIVSYLMYFGIGGYIHWFYYVRQRDTPENWKCQPKAWLSPELERHEIMVGSLSLVFGSAISAAIAAYVLNGGWTMLYYDISDYGYIYFVLQVPLCFIFQDYMTYWHHRIYHLPMLYKHFHKLHHTYKQPTAFSVTAIHPFEFIHMQGVMMSPMFLFPVYWLTFSIGLVYIYYHGIIDHSGVNFKRHWWQPWQPDCIFHDNHHQYFHVNFGFNCELWDKLHGTYRRKDRIYREDIFYGTGKSLDEATVEEVQKDIAERVSENPLAYQGDQRHFDLSTDEIQGLGTKKN
jgi:lathosterol oxidase